MENASKALLIAGGILFAIVLISMLLYMFSSVRNVAKTQDRNKLTQQIAEFNNGFLAYNKQKMYGTDVISAVKKAINYNSTLDASQSNEFINIVLILKGDFYTTEQKYTTDERTGRTDAGPISSIGDASLTMGRHELYDNGEINNNVVNFFSQNMEYAPVKDGLSITYKYSALTNLKRAAFTCKSEDIVYDRNGRIKSMTFEQI